MTRMPLQLFAAAALCAVGCAAPALAQQAPQTSPPDPMDAPAPTTSAMPPAQDMPAMPATPATPAAPAQAVTFTSHPGNSISPNYHVDFDAMDTNHDGAVSRAEARGNPDLTREFHVVDANHNGRLSREEMKGWLD